MLQLCRLHILTLMLYVSSINAEPFYGTNFDQSEVDVIPLEAQGGRGLARIDEHNEKPFDIDVITTDVGGDTGSSHVQPGFAFQQSFPFFGNDFFHSFGGFGIGGNARPEPWWKGPNVCTDKQEDIETPEEQSSTTNGPEDTNADAKEHSNLKQRIFNQFHVSVNSCVDQPNKYECKRVINENGKKKTLTITRKCCHGYGRPRNADYVTQCEKIDIKDLDVVAVDMNANEFVSTAKNIGLDSLIKKRNITVFIPLDAAFTTYKDMTQSETNLVDSRADSATKNLFLRHIVEGEVSLYDIGNDEILKTEQEGQNIRINAYQMPITLSTEPYRYTANCIPIEKHDKITEQGLVHTMNGVFRPVEMSVMEIIRQRADLSIMRTVLEKTKISEILEGDKPVTIFVPTDSAFEKLEPNLRRALKEGKGCATNILKNHILDLTFCSAASVPGAKTTAYNLLGEALRFNRSKPAEEKSEVADLLSQSPVVINGKAIIVENDIMGTNGVMHIIDTILPTESALPLSTLMQQKNVTIFKGLLAAAGLDEKFDDMDNITMFAPTDKALEGTIWAKLLKDSPANLKDDAELINLLNYHVTKPMIKTCDLTEKLLPTVSGSEVRINLYSTHTLFSNVMNRATVNCARLVHFDDESCGSVLHQVDKVLTPPKMNLLQQLEENPEYSRFLDLVHAANLTNVLSNTAEGYTLLVPKNEVFEELKSWEESFEKDPRELENVVKTHIVNDVVCCAGIIPTNWPFVRSIEAINGARLRVTRERRPKIENAGITRCDTVATNGIIHEINDFILPSKPQQRPPQDPFNQGSFDLFF